MTSKTIERRTRQMWDELLAAHRLLERAKKIIPAEYILPACRHWQSKDEPAPANPQALRQFEVKVGRAIIRQNGLTAFIGLREKLFRVGEIIQIACPEYGINFKTKITSNGVRFGRGSRGRHALGGIVKLAKLTPADAKKVTFMFQEVTPGHFILRVRRENLKTLEAIRQLKLKRSALESKKTLAFLNV